ncbi:CotO family spore coat protein [Virgibacillus flavescens]|uniref:CotO family spore coat protein n=1 Tax=Virgibacillus flavescens TaxID=1611422 RepID=UPI003D34696D
MSNQKKFAKTPLLYIHQSNLSNPKAPMQSNYITSRDKSTKPAETKTPKARYVKRTNFFEKVNEEKEPITEKNEENEKPSSNKKFSELTIQEKIDYFLAKPVHIPKMKCEVKTEERTYRGTIQAVEADQVFMQIGRRTTHTKIEIGSIQEIRLIGF